jgi:phycocyanobilin lyase beta subunit
MLLKQPQSDAKDFCQFGIANFQYSFSLVMNALETDKVKALLQAIEDAVNATELANAVNALATEAIPETAPALIRALNYNNPGAAVAAVEGLIKIGEPAVKPLLELLDNYNYGARAWALRALSGIGDPRSLSLLLDTAENDFALSVRRAAAAGLGRIHWERLPAAEVPAAQGQCLNVLQKLCRDSEWVVRYAAIAAIETLIQSNPDLLEPAQATLTQTSENDSEVAVQARARIALQRITA